MHFDVCPSEVADDRATKDDYSLATTGSATTLKVGADGPFLLMITPKNGKKVHPDAPLEISFADNALLKPAKQKLGRGDLKEKSAKEPQVATTLRALKPNLAETKIYVNPPQGGGGCGHTFSRRVNATSTERDDSPEQVDSWNRTWTFFEWNLRPLSEIRKDNEEWKKDPRVASPRVP